MKSTYLVTAINPDDNHIISVWVKSSSIPLAYDSAFSLLRSEYKIEGYLKTVLSVTLMNSNVSQ